MSWKKERGNDRVATILVVEDDQATLKMLELAFCKNGIEPIFAGSYEEAVVRVADFDREPFELAIIDCKLKWRDAKGIEEKVADAGLEIAQQLRINPKTARIPIIIVTATLDNDQLNARAELLADTFIFKPYTLKILFANIRELLEQNQEDKP